MDYLSDLTELTEELLSNAINEIEKEVRKFEKKIDSIPYYVACAVCGSELKINKHWDLDNDLHLGVSMCLVCLEVAESEAFEQGKKEGRDENTR